MIINISLILKLVKTLLIYKIIIIAKTPKIILITILLPTKYQKSQRTIRIKKSQI